MSDIIQKEKTDYRFKLLYAVGIILVVLGHCNGGGLNIFYDWIAPYSYHLSIFDFSSGYFYKSQNEKTPLKYCIKKIKNLLIPLYIWNLFYGIIVKLLSFKGFTIGEELNFYNLIISPVLSGHQFEYNLASWFVIPLFMVEIFNLFLRKILFFVKENIKDFVIFIIFSIFGFLGTFLSIKGYNTNLYLPIMRFLHFLPFYALGTFYKTKLEKYDILPNSIFFGIICIIQLGVLFRYGGKPFAFQCWCDFPYGIMITYIEGFVGIFFWFRICKILEPALGKSKIINSIADNSFSIMINHLMGFMILKTLFALCYKYFNIFSSFNFEAYKSDIWYLYIFGNLEQIQIIYVIFAIYFSIMLQKLVYKLKSIF